MFKTHSQTAMVSAQEVVNHKLIMLVDDDPIFRSVTNAIWKVRVLRWSKQKTA